MSFQQTTNNLPAITLNDFTQTPVDSDNKILVDYYTYIQLQGLLQDHSAADVEHIKKVEKDVYGKKYQSDYTELEKSFSTIDFAYFLNSESARQYWGVICPLRAALAKKLKVADDKLEGAWTVNKDDKSGHVLAKISFEIGTDPDAVYRGIIQVSFKQKSPKIKKTRETKLIAQGTCF